MLGQACAPGDEIPVNGRNSGWTAEMPLKGPHYHPSPPSAAHREWIGAPRRASYTELALIRRLLTCVLILAMPAQADGNSWNKLRFRGGTVEAKVNPFDWNTTLTITPDAITLVFEYQTTLRLRPSQVAALSYGQEAHRRVADMVALSVVATPLALFGILHKSKVHFIGIEYRTENGKAGAILLEADKNNYRLILDVLQKVTGKPVQNAP
jgi:hypothetical protein